MFRHSLFTKLLVTGLLTLLLLIPLAMIHGVVTERSQYRSAVINDVTQSWTGAQTLTSPLLLIPYEYRSTKERRGGGTDRTFTEYQKGTAFLVLMAEQLNMRAALAVEQRSRGIYSVPVYDGDYKISGAFDLSLLAAKQRDIPGFVEWKTPRLIVPISDLRGIGANPKLSIAEEHHQIEPGSSLPSLGNGIHASLDNLSLDGQLPFDIALNLRGSVSLNFIPLAGTTSLTLSANWPHPKFVGRFLPVTRTISDSGFEAAWQVSDFSTGAGDMLERCTVDHCADFYRIMLGVDLIETVDIYTRADRATKYGAMFVILTFVAFFLTETLTQKRLHSMHYLLVGGALTMFYLLLVSFAEHIGFGPAYTIATLACSGLIGIYLTAVLGARRHGATFAGAIGILYSMLFVILHSEDYALLMGTLLLFMVLALLMLSTRHTDWVAVSTSMRAADRTSDA
ncbi:MAG: cell envelope integrity protein CreD [Pseudomonadota bacterium]